MHKSKCHGQKGVDSRRARLRRPEWLRLGITVDRDVVGGYGVNGAVRKRIDDGKPVLLGAERRRQLEGGVVGADRKFVQHEVGWRRVGGDGKALILAATNGFDGGARRDMGDVIPRPGHSHQMKVAVDDDGFGFGRRPDQAKAGRCLAFVHLAGAGQRVVLAMLDKGAVEHTAIG